MRSHSDDNLESEDAGHGAKLQADCSLAALSLGSRNLEEIPADSGSLESGSALLALLAARLSSPMRVSEASQHEAEAQSP